MNLTENQKRALQILLSSVPLGASAVEAIAKQGGHAYLVGGAVRDILLGRSLEEVDIDIEVHGLSLEELAGILQKFAPVDYVGKSFGVLKLHGSPVDWVLPRTDSSGRKPEVTIREDLMIDAALRRRDLTMNAMAIDLTSYDLHDPFGGLEDLKKGVLRSPDIQFFTQDPLRFYRVMQFIGRFNMQPDAELNRVCATMDISNISRERIAAEFDKLLLKSPEPSRGLRWLAAIGRLVELLPEVAQLQGVKQERAYHPEGDVFEHTMQAVDAAATLDISPPFAHAERSRSMKRDERRVVIYAALCHDLGKVSTTKLIDGRLRSFNHEVAGVPLARSLLRRITINKELQDVVCVLVRNHMAPGGLVKSGAGLAAYKRLAVRLAPLTNMYTLALLAYADRRGRNSVGHKPLTEADPGIDQFIARAEEAGVLWQPEPPVLTGADLLDVIKPGPELGKAVKRAYEIQINKKIRDKAELKKRVVKSN
jgi:tRNA nucleotidyltransferase (CCA-adding enzyme)